MTDTPTSDDVKNILLARAKSLASAVYKSKHFPHIKQAHLDQDTPEQSYWNHGYLMALHDVISLYGEDEKIQ